MEKHTILFLAADPRGIDRLGLDREVRAIQQELESAGFRDCFEFETRWAVEPLDLLRALRKLRPTVVHFSGHNGQRSVGPELTGRMPRSEFVSVLGDNDSEQHRGMFFRGSDGGCRVVSEQAIEQAFGAAGSSVRLVVLNACYSEIQANALLAHVDCVVGMSGASHDDAARSFAIGFYGGLGERESVAAAYKQGRAAISLQGLHDSERPQLRVRAGIDAGQLVLAAVPRARGSGSSIPLFASPPPPEPNGLRNENQRGLSNMRLSAGESIQSFASDRMFLVRRQLWRWVGLGGMAMTLVGAAATATSDAPVKTVEAAGVNGDVEPKALHKRPGMKWLPAAEVQLGTPAAELQRLRERCEAAASREICEHLERIGYWSREAPRRVRIAGFYLDVMEVTAGAFAEWLSARRDARVRGEWIELDGIRVARAQKLILYDEGATGRFRVRDGYAAYPMIGVTREGARRMCARRQATLPSGAQWERAAQRAREDSLTLGANPRPCTDVLIEGCVGVASIHSTGYGAGDITSEGIADLLGSVSEWTSDADAEVGAYEIRGGAYSLPRLYARPASRLFLSGTETQDDVGFRCAATPRGSE